MESESYWQLEHDYYVVVDDYDLIIRVIEYEDVAQVEDSEGNVAKAPPKKIHEFKTKRSVLITASPYFKSMLSPEGGFAENQHSTVDLHEDNGPAMNVWLTILHDQDVSGTFANINIAGVWEVLVAAHKYGFNPKSGAAKEWFTGWYVARESTGKKFDFKDYQMLLFPCHSFDYPKGFAAATKYLAYRATGHVTEKRPNGVTASHLHLHASVIQQLNAAKGRLKTILHRGLYAPIERLLSNKACSCKKATLYDYEEALYNTGAWPLETAYMRQSMHDILRLLGDFSGGPDMDQMCVYCRMSAAPGRIVDEAVNETRGYFDGLCLDCMDGSKPKFGDKDTDYWNHDEKHDWDENCRINHGQPSWYFSFMGRRQEMVEWQNQRKAEKRERRNNAVLGY